MRRPLISLILLTTLLLMSCQHNQETEPTIEQQVDAPESDVNENAAESFIEIDEALEISRRVQNQLSDIFNFAYYYYGEQIEPVSTETFQDMQRRLSDYVTAHFLEQELNKTIKEYCYYGCGVLFLPLGINDETTELTEVAANNFTLSTSYEPSIYMHGGIQHLTYVKENDAWKLHARVFEKTTDQLEDIDVAVSNNEDYLETIHPVIEEFQQQFSAMQTEIASENQEEIVSVSTEEAEIKQLIINHQYDIFLEQLADEISKIDPTFNDNQHVWEEMRVFAVQREKNNGSLSYLKWYENMTLARIHSLISRYLMYES